ncbi:MAG: FAD:protein FMN transferase [Rhodobiaceae bacterium]|nr:FAD:protein FMN transferase [Rhodobiaceae bacterium]MCC0054984.1 FAD:protein FMN transferase [Rhodobiaceae bacterium]
MPKMSTDLIRHVASGPTMGTRWSAIYYVPPQAPIAAIDRVLAASVNAVDRQMSSWNDASDLSVLNAAPLRRWQPVSPEMLEVIECGLHVGTLSRGAFDIGMGDAVSAWGFGPRDADTRAISRALGTPRPPANQCLEIDGENLRLRKISPITLDLGGIAKGYGVDRLADTLLEFGIGHALTCIDGELRAIGAQPDGNPWAIAIERPDEGIRAPFSILELADASVATSGDYRHFVTLGERRYSHTMSPVRGGPVENDVASVTVVAETCMEADAWATALMVLGAETGGDLARMRGLNALFIRRCQDSLIQTGTGQIFQSVETDTQTESRASG